MADYRLLKRQLKNEAQATGVRMPSIAFGYDDWFSVVTLENWLDYLPYLARSTNITE